MLWILRLRCQTHPSNSVNVSSSAVTGEDVATEEAHHVGCVSCVAFDVRQVELFAASGVLHETELETIK